MTRTLPLLGRAALLFGISLGAWAQPAPAPQAPPEAPTAASHVARARQYAGEDLRNLMPLCLPQPAARAAPGAAMDDQLRKLIARPAPPPMQVFDNLYFVGGDWVSAWVLKTSAGLILIDALNNAEEAQALIEGGMAKLGLDPRQIKYIVVTHGHGDHYGGASYLAAKYHPRVVASEADWNMMHGVLEFSSAAWGPPPARDIAVRDEETLTLGDTTLTFYVTTGHTLGTITLGFDVRSGGTVHHAILWGGTSFNFGKDFSRLESYSANAARMETIAGRLPVDVLLSNHSSWDGSIPKMNALRSAAPGAPNPFVSNPGTVGRAFLVMNECAQAQARRFGY